MSGNGSKRDRVPSADGVDLEYSVSSRIRGLGWRHLLAISVVWAACLCGLVWSSPSGVLGDAIVAILILTTIAVGYDAVIGLSGQLYLGVNGLVAVGAYAAGLLAIHWTDSPVLGAAVAVAAGAAAAVLSGLIVARLRAFYYAIATLAFGAMVDAILVAWRPVTGGSTGLGPIPGMFDGTIVEPDYRTWILFAGIVAGCLVVGGIAVAKSRLGRDWRVIARDENLARAFGLNVFSLKLVVLAYGGAAAGLGGFMMARYTQFLSPDAFGAALAMQLVLIVFLGGRGSVWGALIGSTIVYGISRYFGDRGEYGEVVLGAVFIGVVAFMPFGIYYGVSRLRRRLAEGRAHV